MSLPILREAPISAKRQFERSDWHGLQKRA
jgi:isocitrate dehydrogenase kinase/phosphatase